MCDPYNDHHTAEDKDCRGTQNSNPLFQLNANLKVNMVRQGIKKWYELRENGKVEKTFPCMA
jgi:hypothetical protein